MGILFNGTTQWVNLGVNLPLLNGAGGGTLMGWIRTKRITGNPQRVVSIAIGPPPGTSNSSRLGLILDAGSVNVIGRDLDAASPTTVASGVVLTPGVWFHVAATYNNPTTQAIIFNNGVAIASGLFTNSSGANFSATNAKNATIGAGSQGIDGFFDGDLEDVRVYNRVLGENEIQTIQSAMGKDGIVAGLEARWVLKELAEGTTISTAMVIADISGQRILGSAQASPIYSAGITSERSRRPIFARSG